jgi:hypothetical protein
VFSLPFLLKGVCAPAVAAFIAALLWRRLGGGARGRGAVAYLVGQVVGTAWMLSDSGEGMPGRNWQWVPWVGVAAAMIGPTVVAPGLATIERWLLALFAAAAAATVFVPAWPDLWPPRMLSMAAFTLATANIARLTDGLTQRTSPRLMALAISAASLVAALLISAAFSLRIGEAALTTAAAFGGTALALLIWPDESAVRGLCLPFALTGCGWCYVTAIEPSPPLVAILFLPATLLVPWLVAIGPTARWNPTRRWLAAALLFAAALIGVAAWVWFSTEDGGDEYAVVVHSRVRCADHSSTSLTS